MTQDSFQGCLLGLALGDAFGAPHEGGPIERLLWRSIGTTRRGERRWTDDTAMSLDLAESLNSRGTLDLDHLALSFARSYRWSRGYGPGAAKLLKRIARGTPWRNASRSVFKDGSYGNGGAMRAPVVGLFYAKRPRSLPDAARRSASVTHAHPLGMEGAALIASATAAAVRTRDPLEIVAAAGRSCELEPFNTRLALARGWLQSGRSIEAKQVRQELGNKMSAAESCVTALYLGTRFLDKEFDDVLGFARRCRGDVDTIAAMAGAIWGAANGTERLPIDKLAVLEGRDRIVECAIQLHQSTSAREAEE